MPNNEQPDVPIWAATKAKKQLDIDVVREAANALTEAELERAGRPVVKLTEIELEAEQLRLEEMLQRGAMTGEDYSRLREVDFYLEGMRERKRYGPGCEEWHPEHHYE